jgi:indole-3-glycerol phosphate synthase
MSDILSEIIQTKKEEVAKASTIHTLSDLERQVSGAPEPRDFEQAISSALSLGRAAVIAEIKKASPSKGIIRENFDPVDIAISYESHGATCLSVLTDRNYFHGSPEFLVAARSATKLPTLRKDFIVDPYQVYEARCMGADCILLIVAALDQQQLRELASLATKLGMSVLVEVHSRRELEQAIELETPLIGVNNRNLRTFQTSLDTTFELVQDLPEGRVLITESGIQTRGDVEIMRSKGIHAFLVGEAFMRQKDVGKALFSLFGGSRSE